MLEAHRKKMEKYTVDVWLNKAQAALASFIHMFDMIGPHQTQ